MKPDEVLYQENQRLTAENQRMWHRLDELAAQVLALQHILGRIMSTADTFSDGEDAINLLAEIAREGLLLDAPAALVALEQRVRGEERGAIVDMCLERAEQRRILGGKSTNSPEQHGHWMAETEARTIAAAIREATDA